MRTEAAMKRILRLGKPTHLKLKNGATACGLVGAERAAYDPRDVECLRCRKSPLFKRALNGNGESK